MQINIKKIVTSEDFSRLRESWNALLAYSPVDSFFLRWEWLWFWWNAYRTDKCELCILIISRGEDIIGIAPFYLTEISWKSLYTIRRLMFLGTKSKNIISEYMDIICRSGMEEVVFREIFSFIEKENLCDDICLHKVDASSISLHFFKRLCAEYKYQCIINNMGISPYVRLPENHDLFMDSLSGTMRHNIKTSKKRLYKYDNIVFRKTSGVSEFEADFKELVRLHQWRWQSRNLTGSFSGYFYSFQETVLKEMLLNGNLELVFLSVSGKNIAVLYNIKYKKKIYYYQGGLDVSFDKRLSPGLLLHSYCIEKAIRDKINEYDFLYMGQLDGYKKRWTDQYRKLCDISVTRSGILKIAKDIKTKAGKLLSDNETASA